jgi:hypothetical protein
VVGVPVRVNVSPTTLEVIPTGSVAIEKDEGAGFIDKDNSLGTFSFRGRVVSSVYGNVGGEKPDTFEYEI